MPQWTALPHCDQRDATKPLLTDRLRKAQFGRVHSSTRAMELPMARQAGMGSSKSDRVTRAATAELRVLSETREILEQLEIAQRLHQNLSASETAQRRLGATMARLLDRLPDARELVQVMEAG